MNTLLAHASLTLVAALGQANDPLFVAKPLTEKGQFTTGIEGPACDAEGNVLAVNFARQGTIGRVTPDGRGEVLVELKGKSVGNGIRFDRQGVMYIADYVNHNILRVDPQTSELTTHAHEDSMNQPNDLAIGPDGTLYASDPNWDRSQAQQHLLWRAGRPNGVRDRSRIHAARSVPRRSTGSRVATLARVSANSSR